MAKSATELRSLAANCAAQARQAGPRRAAQLRECAQSFRRQARRLELLDHSRNVGRANVTPASYREHLRARRA